jgi:transposase
VSTVKPVPTVGSVNWDKLARRRDFVMALVRCGYTQREIGKRVGISGGRVSQIVIKARRRERWLEANQLKYAAQDLLEIELGLIRWRYVGIRP